MADITAEHFEYLDDLRDSGETNMWGAGAYLEREFGLTRAEAREILTAWMHTFSCDKTPAERVAEIKPA